MFFEPQVEILNIFLLSCGPSVLRKGDDARIDEVVQSVGGVNPLGPHIGLNAENFTAFGEVYVKSGVVPIVDLTVGVHTKLLPTHPVHLERVLCVVEIHRLTWGEDNVVVFLHSLA